MMIASRTNTHIKMLRSLHQRKEREQAGLYLIEGIHIVIEAIHTGAPIEALIVAPELLTSAPGCRVVDEQRRAGVACLEVTPDVFRSISVKEGPQGLGAVVRQRWERLERIHPGNELGWVVLAGVQDPGNLGTILRTSDAVGGAGVILLGQTTDPYDPSTIRATMGAIFSQRLARATIAELTAWKARHHLTFVGASGDATTDYQAIRYPTPVVLCMGSEQHGLTTEQRALCDHLTHIPMVGRSDSLNLAVATGVVLYEIFNQQRR